MVFQLEPEEFIQFYNEYKIYIAEGIATEDVAHRRDEMAKLLRYESSNKSAGEVTSLRKVYSFFTPFYFSITYFLSSQ